MATRHTGTRNSLDFSNSDSAKTKNVVENYEKNFREIKCIIMDDETYCKLDCSTFQGQQFHTISKGTMTDVLLKAIKTENFGKKDMVW